MAPNCPDEVDVFSGPHSRMKQLVHKYLDLVCSTNFSNVTRMVSVLEKLLHTFHAFKAHEQIENHLIMHRLKEKMKALDITDAAVCNCHSDNRLTEMLSLVLDGYRWTQSSERERVKYGLKLRRALEDFTKDFIPHMKEEEEVFQPMLVEYFTYDELKQLKAKVIQQHQEKIDEAEDDSDEKCLPECDSDKEELEEVETSPAEQLPTEVMMQIFSYLSPRDLCRCSRVSQRWNQLALDPSLWPAIYPVQWAAGDWSFHPKINDDEESETPGDQSEEDDVYYVDDEDADKDESSDSETSDGQPDTTMEQALREVRVICGLVKHVLPRVGEGVHVCHLSHSRGISSSLVHKILKLCPNLTTLNLAYTKITDAAFKEYGLKEGQCKLEHLDLSSCENISDNTLYSLAASYLSTPVSGQTPRIPCRSKKASSPPCIILTCSNDSKCDPETSPLISEELRLTPSLPLESCSCESLGKEALTPVGCGGIRKQTSCCQAIDFHPPASISSSFRSCCVKRTCGSDGEGRDESRTAGCCGAGDGSEVKEEVGNDGGPPHALHRLTHLSLNSCYRITNLGVKVLSERGGLPQLQHLDLSGCLNLTGEGIARLVDTCQSLDHAYLFYCDNVYPDPYPSTASGCRNLECGLRFCCRSGD